MSEQTKTRKELEAQIIAKAWQDEAFKQELLSNPKAALSRELQVQNIPASLEIQVLEETPNTFYLVLPMQPNVAAANEELSEEQLMAVAGGALPSLHTTCVDDIASTIMDGVRTCTSNC